MFTLQEVANELKITTPTLRQLIQRGELPASRIGRLWRIAPADLTDYLQRSKTEKYHEHDLD